MTPAARVQAAIDLLDQIIAAAGADGAAADTLIARYFKERRYAGSGDRKAVRELVYRAIRRTGDRPQNGRAAMIGLAREDNSIAAHFDGSHHGPAPMNEAEPGTAPGVLPGWIVPELAALVDDGEQAALIARAPLHVRINPLRADLHDIQALWPDAEPVAGTAYGLTLPSGTQVEASAIWAGGGAEIQDGGSQMIAAACSARAGQTILDLCAGAGGKTLALAADMGGEGRLIAADVVRDRLARLSPRAERAGAGFIETLLLNGGREAEALRPLTEQCDCVLVDAPCSGTGTWRRNPEARWRLTPARLDRLAALQVHVLDLAAPLVKPGGALVYAVCSLTDREGHAQIDAFLQRHAGWSAVDVDGAGRRWGAGRILTPAHDGTDGFFFARLEKPW